MKILSALLLGAAIAGSAFCNAAEKYKEDYASLAKHGVAPEWIQDAKFGMYMHWGVYTVPAYMSEWYPRYMYDSSNKSVQNFHKLNYGEKFEYHQFIPFFTGEFFDPADWAKLMRQTGAKFGGMVAEHHDGFSMWKSKISPWNAGDMGIKRDVLGEFFKALQRENLKTIATFHHAFNLQRARDLTDEDPNTDGFFYKASADSAAKSKDPKLGMLYGNMNEAEWLEKVWYGKLEEVIDNYKPDAIWFDFRLKWIPDSYKTKFAAHYFNKALEENREVAIIRKNADLPESFAMLDMERSRLPQIRTDLWMTDDAISPTSWSYTRGMKIKQAGDILHSLIDTVSKNGVLLFNISPRSDGVIPEDQRKTLLEIGEWLSRYGESIYSTRAWIHFGEGIVKEPDGGFKDHEKFLKIKYSANDIRYTRSKDGKTIYAIIMGWPSQKEIVFETFKQSKISPKDIKRISMLGTVEKIDWSMPDGALKVSVPSAQVDEKANVYKIELF